MRELMNIRYELKKNILIFGKILQKKKLRSETFFKFILNL